MRRRRRPSQLLPQGVTVFLGLRTVIDHAPDSAKGKDIEQAYRRLLD